MKGQGKKRRLLGTVGAATLASMMASKIVLGRGRLPSAVDIRKSNDGNASDGAFSEAAAGIADNSSLPPTGELLPNVVE